MPQLRLLPTAFTVVALAAGATASTAAAAPGIPAARAAVAAGLVSPLSVALKSNGTAIISENFAGLLVKKAPGKKPKTIYTAKQGNEVGSVSVRRGVVTFSVTLDKERGGRVMRMQRSGNVSTLANVGRFESRRNPDGDVTYGFREISDRCASRWPQEFGPTSYKGVVETHPYGTAVTSGPTYLADAAGNSLLKIGSGGAVSTVAVLPAVPVKITGKFVKANGLPKCIAGLTYYFEPVPTDVERGPGRQLFVSTLTGGPEDGSLGAQSRVYTVDPSTGTVTEVAAGMAGAVGLAVAKNGDIYVSELFGERISRIPAGTSTTKKFRSVVLPAAVEIANGSLYVTTNVLSEPPAGKLVRFGF